MPSLTNVLVGVLLGQLYSSECFEDRVQRQLAQAIDQYGCHIRLVWYLGMLGWARSLRFVIV